jgi:two-component system, sensor histidine kinase and response regulator
MDPVLIVDDEKDNLEALKRLLRSDYQITTCESPLEALKLLPKQTFHVIVSDQRMPEMTGVEFLEKAKDVCPLSTRILLTGYTDVESVIGAINRGNIYRYVAKPWDPDDLRLTLRQANEAFQLKNELEQKNVALAKSNDELKRALRELTVLDRAKARFLSLVSHELNTPLTVLSSFVSMMVDSKEQLPPDFQKAVVSVSRAAERFGEIVGEVITFVRLESDNRLSVSAVDLEKLTVGLLKDLEAERAARQVSFKGKLTKGVGAKGDPDKLREALKFFLKDAMARSPKGKEVQLEVSRQGDWVYYRLTREGEPVSAEALTALETGSQPLHHEKNLGLALAICRIVIELHGGAVIREESPAGKATLALKLPAA